MSGHGQIVVYSTGLFLEALSSLSIIADCTSELSPAFPLPELVTAPRCLFTRAYFCCWVFDGLFPEFFSPFRANSLLSLVGHMSSMIC